MSGRGLRRLARLRRWGREMFGLQQGSDIEGAVEAIRGGVPVRGATVWVLVCAALLAALGLDTSSSAVVIGAMLISPLMSPILGVGLGVAAHDRDLLLDSLRNLTAATVIALAASSLYFAVTPLGEPTSELLARTRPTLLDVGVAFFGGVAGIVAVSRRSQATVVPGVAIATALMPPLCTAGFGLATGRFTYFVGAFYLFFLNAVFIATATYIVARILHVAPVRQVSAASRRRVEQVIWAIVVAATVPAGLLLYDAVQEARLRRTAEAFVERTVEGDGREVVRWSFDARRPIFGGRRDGEIKVYLAGRTLAGGEADSLAALMRRAGLDHHRLRLVALTGSAAPLSRDDLAALLATRTGLGAPVAGPPHAGPDSAAAAPPGPAPAQLLREARLVVAALDTLGQVDGLRFGIVADSLPTFLVRLDGGRAPTLDERRRLAAFLALRTAADTVRIATF